MNTMEEKKKKNLSAVTGLVAAALLVVVFTCGILNMNGVRLKNVERQMSRKYGVSFADENNSLTENGFNIKSADGIRVYGTCNWFGKVKTESYINYAYADESIEYIREKIGSYFDECLIIRDNMIFSELSLVQFDSNSIKSFEDYEAAVESYSEEKSYYKMAVRVYIREDESIDHIAEAISVLKENNETWSVYFFAVPDDLFDMHIDRNLYCYCIGEPVFDAMECMGTDNYERVENLIYRKEGECGLYSPRYNMMEVLIDDEWVDVL